MEFNLLISDILVLVSCKFKMRIFEMSLVIKHYVLFAFLLVYTVVLKSDVFIPYCIRCKKSCHLFGVKAHLFLQCIRYESSFFILPGATLKETKSATMNIFRFFFIFYLNHL